MSSNGRRGFLKMLGLGGAGVVLGGTSALADKLGDEVVQEGADKGLYSQELADEVINAVQYKEPRSGYEPVSPLVGKANPTMLVNYNYSQRLDYELFAPFKQETHNTMRAGDVINTCQPQGPTVRKKEPGEFLEMDSIVHVRQFETQHFYDCILIRDEFMETATQQDVFRLFCEPSIQSLGRHLNEGGYKMSFPLPTIDYNCGIMSKVHTSGSVPVRVSVQYDIENMGYRLTMEVLVA